jgi:hypothetical protein
MKRLLTIGDSHTAGAEILGAGNYLEQNKLHAWPAHLGKLLNYHVDNLGESGGSIKRTERVLIDYLATNGIPDLVIIGWTCLGRWEMCLGETKTRDGYYYNQYNSWFDDNSKSDINKYNSLLPIITADDILAEKYRTVIRCQQLLKSYNIPYIMFDVMQNTKYEAPISGRGTTKVDKSWDGLNTLDIALEKMIDTDFYINTIYWEYLYSSTNNIKFPNVKINGGHLNEEGHIEWSKFLLSKLKNI